MSIWQVRGTFHIEYGRDYADMVLAPPAPPPPLLPTSTEHSGLYLSGYIKLTGHMRGVESLGGGVGVCRQLDHLLRAAQIPGNYLEQAQSTLLRMDHLDYREGLHRTNTAHHTNHRCDTLIKSH